ncbi:MAG: glycosyltransferase family 1 protein [Candidatus Shapirobacteria bacterium]|nr:glycosyltransferase family 1 protein [Candidatus Shapirobacteria bacterium]MDD4410492.1 glycosyltransferase family 1 protein [Candidatus Shapirobacteria bacterium]
MIIGIDISSVPYKTGVSNYTLNLVRNLVKLDKINTYKLFYSSMRLSLPEEIIEIKKNHSNVLVYQFKLPPTLLQILWNQLQLFPIEFFIGKCDIFHTSDWTQPPTLKAKTIATIHDLTPFLHPEWHHQKVITAHKNKMKLAAEKCFKFICVSQNTKNDLLKIFPKIDPQKIEVIYEAAEEKYGKFIKLSKDLQQKKKDAIKKQYGLDKFILAQGTREPRKNLKRLIEAFVIFKKNNPNCHVELAIAGKYGWGQDIDGVKNPSVKILGFIPEKDMVALHASAICLAYPSLYEGFGLPLVKSLKVGTPIITSNISSMPEVSDKAALYVDPTSIPDMTNAITKIVKLAALRKKLKAKGLIQAKKFDWLKTAEQTLNVYVKTG